MADISKIKINETEYDIKDKTARESIENIPNIISEYLEENKENLGGKDGVGIAKIEKTSTGELVDTYTITFTDNTTTVFTVTNGKDGKNGIDGKDGIDGFSPIITENTENTEKVYKLDITDKNGVFTTPNLKGDTSNFSLPKLFLEGDTTDISKDNTVSMIAEYISNEMNFSEECTLKWQGTSSLNYPKKNFTIKLNNKFDLGFGEQKKYCLKANYIDHSHARNIVSARLWSEIVSSRENYDTLPIELKNTPNNGAIDGFPIKLYLNGIYEGIYTLNIPKDAWMFNMDDSKEKHCVLCGENYKSGCFRATAKIDGTDWSDEVHDKVPTTILTRWNEVISFVMNSSDDEFMSNIDNYIDLESLIDYYIFAYVSCGLDSMGKNQIYCTYDGQKWYASMYDMDSTWGLYWNGSHFVSSEYRCQKDYEAMTNSREGNLLFERLFELFNQEIVERYNELRKNVLSVKNIICKFEEFTDLISSDLYAEDIEIYTSIPSSTTNNIKQIRKYAKNRLDYVDNNIEKISLTSIVLHLTSPLYVNSGAKLTTIIEPTNANNYELDYESDNTEIATVNENGVVTGLKEGIVNISVIDNKTGLADTLEVTVSIKSETTENENLIFRLDNNSVNEDGDIERIVGSKYDKNYVVAVNGILTVGENDNGIIFDGSQNFMIALDSVVLDTSRSIVMKFKPSENTVSGKSYNILSHASIIPEGAMKWGTGHTGFYYKATDSDGYLLADIGITNTVKTSDNIKLYPSTIHTLVSVYDKDNAKYKIYLDSVLVKETTSIANSGITSCDYLGNTEGKNPFVGKMYELSLYDKALTEEEIANL